MSRRVMTFRPINSFSAESSRQRVRRSLREQGLARTALALGLSARWRLRLFDEDFRARRFDRRLGVDTRGIVRHDPDNEELRGVRHAQSVRERDFRAAFAHVDVDRERTLFLDLGCGKGKALLLAREAGFRRVLGVELSEEIADIATRNVERTAGTVVVADATRFEFPPDPTVLFLCNPLRSGDPPDRAGKPRGLAARCPTPDRDCVRLSAGRGALRRAQLVARGSSRAASRHLRVSREFLSAQSGRARFDVR